MNRSDREEAPVVQLVDRIVRKAVTHQASDIHFESAEHNLRVRYRIDGILSDQPAIEKNIAQQVLSRIKVLANIDITEKRIPQDGKFRFAGQTAPIDIRVSTFPAIHGEKIVMRILDRSNIMIQLDSLGMNADMLAAFKQLLKRPQGFFLVTGPTGSGKTTTLYAALATMNCAEKNIITLEDPVEYNVAGITQGQINPDTGFTFQKGVRAILRQDPDIVMVGEIRDSQTAQIAIEAALTGHLILSTLHTNNAPAVIMRLMDMGIEPFLLNAAITGVLAQRLARKICSECRTQEPASMTDKAIMERFGFDMSQIYKGKGCDTCMNLGYKGRVGIFELLTMSSALRALVVKHPSADALYAQALADGMRTLQQDGIEKVKQGIISLEELARVLA